jgi:LuxR family maltose regulon positive regulatory protein
MFVGEAFGTREASILFVRNYQRPRVDRLYESALKHKLVLVTANTGYGKTSSVHAFVQKSGIKTMWMQLSEYDNSETHFWENYIHAIGRMEDNDELTKHLTQVGFPNSDDKFSQYITLIRRELPQNVRCLLVLDDFHLLHNRSIIEFVERMSLMLTPTRTLILISRTLPDINSVITKQLSRNSISFIEEDELRFTENEIEGYFRELGIPLLPENLQSIISSTQGWAFAVNLTAQLMKKNPKFEQHTLNAIRRNIIRLIEREAFADVPEPIKKAMVRLSLIDHLSAELVESIVDDEEIMEQLHTVNSYIRYDVHMNTYLIHHLFLEYLEQQQGMLTEEEKRDTYRKAADWCRDNNYMMDAIRYCELLGNYEEIAEIASQYYMQMPVDIAKSVMDIFDRAPDGQELVVGADYFPLMYIRMTLAIGMFEEGLAKAKEYEQKFLAMPDSLSKQYKLAHNYLAMAAARQVMAIEDGNYDFDKYYALADQYYPEADDIDEVRKDYPVCAWATWVGTSRKGAIEENIAVVERSIKHTMGPIGGYMRGLDDLMRGELLMMQYSLKEAEPVFLRAAQSAQESGQFDITARSLMNIMRINIMLGELANAERTLDGIRALIAQPDYAIGAAIYDISRAIFHLTKDESDLVPEWLCGNFTHCVYESFLENLINHVKMRYYYTIRNYYDVLAYVKEQDSREVLLYSKIELKIYEALSLRRIKRHEEAYAAFEKAFDLAAPNGLDMMFIAMGKDMRTITAAMQREEGHHVPNEWLSSINRKASAFAKRQSYMLGGQPQNEGDMAGLSTLSIREMEVLYDLSHGLSRSEIAASRMLSVNTVKMVTSSLYDKLGVSNIASAIRVAADKGLLGAAEQPPQP